MNKQTYIQPETEIVVLVAEPFQEDVPVHWSNENDGEIETNQAFFDGEEGGDPFFDN